MIAYKFLRPGGIGTFSGYAWPLPAGAAPGPWVEAGEGAIGCVAGVHACTSEDLPIWIAEELWVAELDGEIQRMRTKVVATRGRLVARVRGWDAAAAEEFGRACARRAAACAEGLRAAGSPPDAVRRADDYAADAAAEAGAGRAATAAYIAAHAGAHAAGGTAGAGAERAWQAAWLAHRLTL